MLWSISLVILCLSYISTYKLCSDPIGIFWDLKKQNLTDVPKNIPRNITTLDLSCNQITIIRNQDFQLLENLTCLILSFNPISVIEEDGFMGLDNLQMLELNNHSVDYDTFEADVFLPIENLQNLSMRTNLDVPNNKVKAVKVLKNFKNLTTAIIDTASETVFDVSVTNLREIKQLVIGSLDSFECGLQFFKNDTFQGLSKLGVEVLDLSYCTALDIQDDFLKPLEHLKTFLFRSGVFPVKVGLSDLIRTLRLYMNKPMKEINLSNQAIEKRLVVEDLTIISMEILGNICVEKLILSNNNINIIDFNNMYVQIQSGHLVFPCLRRSIKHLDLSSNRISGTYFKPGFFLMAFMENLEFLDVSGEYLFNRRYDFSFTQAYSTYTDKLLLNDIIFFMPKKLKHFNFGGGAYRLGRLINITFENADSLRYCNLSLTGLYGFNVTLKGLENLETLDFSGNDVSVIIETFFDTFPNVTHLRLADCVLDGDFILTHGRRLFQPLKNLEILDLSRNNLIKLPKDIFKSLNQLKIINLAFNKLFSHPDYLNTPYLQKLYLNFNNFITFSSQEIQMFNKLENMRKDEGNLKLYIYGNSLACTCETYSFISWMTFTTIDLDRKNYTCIDQKSDLIFTADFKNSDYIQLCMSSVWLNISVFLSAAILVIIFTVFVFVKNKLTVKIFIQRLLGKFVYPKRRQDFRYDAFIIYPESLYKLVCFDMVDNLEKRFALKFYIPHRDQLFGICKEEDITESCKNSWKLVLILTQEFMDEPLAYFTLSSCLTSITLTTPNRLILIIDSKLNILPNIEFFLESVSESNVLYTDFDNPLPGEFWTQLNENFQDDKY